MAKLATKSKVRSPHSGTQSQTKPSPRPWAPSRHEPAAQDAQGMLVLVTTSALGVENPVLDPWQCGECGEFASTSAVTGVVSSVAWM
ncbi:uncharacterized protein SETTUDRAFT_19184 [Exserohilum turcica Et28A]|uniref:Uncharacterized protein n=1 Tax=Exserohilum turcicum (strain 28A) TaxID=671987 RepID=R0K0P6_EXST2|nr:uncharacterized protein SETTUDRAFT_19184 [Exserohilum turcica Et28A]EOA86668.1 hypothetical protein SETTUDRAFT_19184 [Exserohilum turcica Et28A]